jgi:hypothetical protein
MILIQLLIVFELVLFRKFFLDFSDLIFNLSWNIWLISNNRLHRWAIHVKFFMIFRMLNNWLRRDIRIARESLIGFCLIFLCLFRWNALNLLIDLRTSGNYLWSEVVINVYLVKIFWRINLLPFLVIDLSNNILVWFLNANLIISFSSMICANLPLLVTVITCV